ncbi:hypothetical protein VP01_1075g6 [Puccinia sorghi]|uniref:Uncharacterized protein n=1 Tax=Puccinia sorghi TaxID=27349 RepID=A0A0L6VTI3_9BASI|nr:hypothetical protein VP01_1075g6 [Puccinia sorghi]
MEDFCDPSGSVGRDPEKNLPGIYGLTAKTVQGSQPGILLLMSSLEGRYIDHFLNTPEVVSMVKNVIVEKSLFNISDHWPVIQNTEHGIDGHGWELALSNRWNVLTVDEIQDETELSETAKLWVDTLTTIGEEVHLLSIPREQQQFKFDRKTLKLIKNLRRSQKKIEKVIREGIQPSTLLTKVQETSIQDQNWAKLAIRKFEKQECLRKSQQINDLLLKNEGQDFHWLIQQGQGKQHGNLNNAPCFNEQEVLVTSAEDILKARAEYSAKISSDPTRISTDPTKWTHTRPKEAKQDSVVSDIDEEVTLTKPELLMEIRQIQRNAAPEKSVKIGKEPRYGKTPFAMPLDYSTVALDCWSLPQTLLVPPLKTLLNIMRAFLRLKTQPKIWNEEVLITLPKPGQDQRWLKNTRGITLSCTKGNLLLTIFSSRLQKRPGGSCTCCKPQLNTETTKVPHEGLWAKLRHIGIHNNLVELIKKGYDSSKIQCRLGDQLSDPFTRGIGTHQGCPLSPLPFIIFVNDLFREVTEGIERLNIY